MFIRYKYHLPAGFVLVLLSLSSLSSFRLPDTGLIQTITARLNTYREYYQPDKLYLLTDRPYYTAGETIWLKAYQVDADTHTPHSKSRVMYVELLNPTQKLVTLLKLRVENTTTTGTIQLPGNLPAGTYILRAYTKWMLNSGTDFIFSRPIHIYQPDQDMAGSSPEALPLADLQFFPEGGYLVNDVPSTVAFKAVNKAGKGVDVQGTITDQSGSTVATFQSMHLGMGTFRMQPEAGKTYNATLVTGSGDTLTYALPKALAEGWVMTTDNTSPEEIKVQVQMAGSTAGQASIIAQGGGHVLFSTTLTGSDAVVSIPKRSLPEGVIHITAFDGFGNARCERLAFVKHANYLRIQVVPDKKTYSPREKVSLDITVQDKSGNPVAANLAMAITDAGQVAHPAYRLTLLSYLLLTSDLKGYVEQPGFYFSADAKADKALDCLLLTQGWRRFTWKQVLQPSLPELRYDMENGLSLRGQLLNPAQQTPVANQLITLSIPGGNPAFYQAYTDQEGYFEFTDFSYYQDKDLFLRTVNQPGMQLKMDTLLDIPLVREPAPSFTPDKVRSFLEKSNRLKKIQSAFDAEEDGGEQQTTEEANPVRTTVADVPADHIIDLDRYNQFPSMPETLKEIVPGLIIKDKKGVYSLRVLNIKRKMYFTEEPVYFIDGLLFTSNDFFLKLDPAAVQTVEVYGRPDKLARFGNFGLNGVIAAYTRNGDFYPADIPGLTSLPFRGYSQIKEYYTPLYASSDADSQIPDLRPLIYWNPSVTTDANGKAQVTFYNTDNLGTYEINIEGLSGRGIPGEATMRYDVQLIQSKK